MKVSIKKLQSLKNELVLVPVVQEKKKVALNKNTAFLKKDFSKIGNGFSAQYKSVALHKNFFFIGLGEESNLSSYKILQAFQKGIQALKNNNPSQFSIYLSSIDLKEGYGKLIAQACAQSFYSFNQFKTGQKPSKSQINFFVSSKDEEENLKKELSFAQKINGAADWARDLGNLPANELNAQKLAEHAKTMAKNFKLVCTVWGKKELQKNKFGALLSVNKGSYDDPAFIILEYNKDKKNLPTLCLVGKGITFDTGGSNLKPSKNLDEMKFDMCGAALVLGVTQAAAALHLPIHLVTLVSSTDNRISNTSTLPSDIITSYSGKTIEVLNTDAEGRLVLADALSYAEKFKPQAIIDAATLTGACSVSLGPWFAGLLGNDEKLLNKIKQASSKTGEKVWQLPLSEEHMEAMQSQCADISNLSKIPGGGTSTAAKFLEFFVPQKTPWAHFDIAGIAWANKQATGFGVALLVELLQNWKQT
ncbi:MAG: leucyl aminopeptidase [Deltaproteobacteria bacterium]|nr:leucyl aminopeptidase [Deltaproteobacteria bacterium]